MNSIDKEVLILNAKTRLTEDESQIDMIEMKNNYERIKRIREKFEINKSKAKKEYIELVEKLAFYEKEMINYNENEVLTLLKEVLELKRNCFPQNHESIANTLNNLGLVYDDLGDNNKAKEFYEETLEIYRKTLPENHNSIADTLNNLGSVYSALGDKNKAK